MSSRFGKLGKNLSKRLLSIDGQLRASFLFWLFTTDHDAGKRTSLTILSDDSVEPLNVVKQQAIAILCTVYDENTREALIRFARSQLEVAATVAGESQPQNGVLVVLEWMARTKADEHSFSQEILLGFAARNLSLWNFLPQFLSSLSIENLATLVEALSNGGYSQWVASELVPKLASAQPVQLASTCGEPWWPDDARLALASISWEEFDDDLYVVVLREIHTVNDAAAQMMIRQNVRQRCQQLEPEAISKMPRTGVRELLRLCLDGRIDPQDADLQAAATHLDDQALRAEIKRASWTKPERAENLAKVVAVLKPELLPHVLTLALERGSETAMAMLGALSADAVEPHVDELLLAAKDDEPVLGVLCRLSDSAAALVFERWGEHLSMVAFRALEGTEYAGQREEHVKAAIRSYSAIGTTDRAELLAALPDDERVEALLTVVSDRTKPAPNKPATDDVMQALELLGKHLEEGLDPENVTEVVATILP
jgi:hypothetical protein